MKITIYELLGLIKDGKAPKKIKYREKIFTWDDEIPAYFDNERKSFVQHYMDRTNMLYDEIEILEEVEDKEYEVIEELGTNFTYGDCTDELTTIDWQISVISNKINALIRNQKYILEQLKNK